MVLRARAALALSQGGRPAPGDPRGVPGAVRRGPPGAARGGGLAVVSAVPSRRGRASPRCSPPRASSRSCASPPASCARCICSSCRPTSRPRPTCARRSRSRSARRRGEHIPPCSPRPQGLLYSEHVRYVEQLRRYHAVFAREQVLVLIYDDFRADNEATVRRVLRFLDVDDTAPIEAVEANPTVGIRYKAPAPGGTRGDPPARSGCARGQGLGQDARAAAPAHVRHSNSSVAAWWSLRPRRSTRS